jgi:SPP1 family predicted phage head-tail adaptor
MLSPGALRDRVTIQAATETQDAHRGFVEGTPTTVCARIPAEVTQLTGRELERAMAIDPRIAYRVRVRYRNDIAARQTAIYHAGVQRGGDKTLEIIKPPIVVDGRYRELHLWCMEAV